jgi:hypothetical protein
MSVQILQMENPSWLLLLYTLPTKRTTARVNFWRKLRKFGAVQLKTTGYVLPDEPRHLERFQWLSKEIQDSDGEATLIRVAEIDGMSSGEIVAMFNEGRGAEYKELGAACQAALSRHKKGREPELSAELEKQKRRFREIREIDYFDAPAAHDAQMVLQRLEKALAPQKRAPAAPKLEASHFARKIWLTRPRPGIDRAGSAWLIRKFIDPEAKFIFDMDTCKHPNALPFDMADVEFSHHGDDCTFETLVKRFEIPDKAVLKMAEMVHDADLEDDKFHQAECIGIDCILTGWAKGGLSDGELLSKGIDLFEALHTAIRK